MSEWVAGILILAVWLAWGLQFMLLLPGNRGKPVRKDSRARAGMILEGLAYCVVYAHGLPFWLSPAAVWRIAGGAGCAILAFVLSLHAIGHLGRQFRVDAGLNDDHELIRTGAYRYVRHPLYASMLWLLLMSIALMGTFPGWLAGMALFIAGTEIRVRAEDALLRDRFGEQFLEWQRRVPAYMPFVR